MKRLHKTFLFTALLVTSIAATTTTAQTQKGADIDGEAAGDESGRSVSMPDANTVAIGATGNDGNGIDAGHARIYSWNGNKWVQKGADIDGEAKGDRSGWSVSMPDSNTVAIGATDNLGTGRNGGHVRIYTWSGSAWIQKGTDIEGEAEGDYSGWSVSMPDANTVAIGGDAYNGNGDRAGHVRIYTWNGSAWLQKGADIDGENAGDWSGSSVSMPNPYTVAIGAPYNDGNGKDAGYVRVYSLNPTTVENSFVGALRLFPNPTKAEVNIELESNYNTNTNVVIRNTLGQEIAQKNYLANDKIKLSIAAPSGIYFIEITTEDKRRAMVKVVKE